MRGLPSHGKGHHYVVCVWDSRFHDQGKMNNIDLERKVVYSLDRQEQVAQMASELPDVVEMLAEFYLSGQNRHTWQALDCDTVAIVEISFLVADSSQREVSTEVATFSVVENQHILSATLRLHNAQTGDAIEPSRSDTNRANLPTDSFLLAAMLEVAIVLSLAVDPEQPSRLKWPLPSTDSPP